MYMGKKVQKGCVPSLLNAMYPPFLAGHHDAVMLVLVLVLSYNSASTATPSATTPARPLPSRRAPSLVVCCAGAEESVPLPPAEPSPEVPVPEELPEPLPEPPAAVPLPDMADGILPGDRFSAAAAASWVKPARVFWPVEAL